MTAGAHDVLMAGVADLIALLFVFLRMREEYVRGMGKVVACAIVAECLPMTIETSLLIGLIHITMLDRPAEIRVGGWHGADDHRCFHQQVIAAPNDGNRMAQVALHADGFLAPIRLDGYVLSIVATKTSRIIKM